jgi:peptidoglycan/LPS O-acetylase OafA/YrhL
MKSRSGIGGGGHLGVLLFFVHTSLVLMMSMERLGLSGWKLYRTFMVRRFFRIYPLSVLSVVAVVYFRIPPHSWRGTYEWMGVPAFISNLLLTQNLTQTDSLNCVLWSLPFELQMYAILPLLFFWALHFPSQRAMAGAWFLAAALAIAEYIGRSWGDNPAISLFYYFPCFLAGVFAWRRCKVQSPRLPGWAWTAFLVALVVAWRLDEALRNHAPSLLGAFAWAPRSAHGNWWPQYFEMVNDWLFCAAAALAIPCFMQVRSRWLIWIGKRIARYSYGVYICHVPILWVCFVRLHVGSAAMSALLAILLTAVVSVLVYHGLEDPAIRVGKRVAARMVQRRAVV